MKSKISSKLFLIIAIAALILVSLAFTFYVNSQDEEVPSVIISEVIASNKSLLADKHGHYFDIIELYNPADTAIDLTGYGLSDTVETPHRWVFPDTTIQPNEYLIIYLSKTPLESYTGLYADFALDMSGEIIVLTNSDKKIVQILPYGAMHDDMSLSLINGEYQYVVKGTPGEENKGEIVSNLSTVGVEYTLDVSIPPGVYGQPIYLEFISSEDLEIRYTIDGTNPTISSKEYHLPVYLDYSINNLLKYANIPSTFHDVPEVGTEDVNKATIVKAQLFKNGVPVGDMFTGTYFVFDEGIDSYNFDLISLTTDPSNLYDPYTGIHVVGEFYKQNAPEVINGGTTANYNRRGFEWERDALIEFFDSEGQRVLTQKIGIRIFGDWSRSYAKKSFKLYPRKIYEDRGSFSYPFFEDLTDAEGNAISSFNRLLLRTGGQDWEHALFTDPLVDSLVSDILDYQAFKPVILFLNGEYWGIYHLREHMDENYLQSHFDVAPENISIITHTSDAPQLYRGDAEDIAYYHRLLDFANETDLSIDSNFAEIENMIDVDNFIDYYCLEMFIFNNDWPGNNIKIWRYDGEADPENEYTDGKYRYLLYDTEFSFGLYAGSEAYKKDSFEHVSSMDSRIWPNPWWSNILFKRMMENEKFKERFLTTFADYLNSRFSKETFDSQIEYFTELYEPEMQEYINRYYMYSVPDIPAWKDQINRITEFVDKRHEYIYITAANYYNIADYYSLDISKFDNGTISVNDKYTIDFANQNKNYKTIQYFDGFTIEIKAVPDEGYDFEGWIIKDKSTGKIIMNLGDSTSADGTYKIENNTLFITPNADITLEVVFK